MLLFCQCLHHLVGDLIGLAYLRETALFAVLLVLSEGLQHHAVHVGILLHELRYEAVSIAHHILIYQHLSVAVLASADADGQRLRLLRHELCQRLGHALQRDGKGTSLFDSLRVFE